MESREDTDLSPQTDVHRLEVDGKWFRDRHGRICMLRGVNLSGSSKMPLGQETHAPDLDAFYDHRNASFVGRPFPLSEADVHLRRLKSWGFMFLRFQVTWEALEHAGPGIYDEDYIAYLIQILQLARKYGFRCFIDPHQDVWSRFTGGSGAPGWTLELVGFDMKKFATTDAALVHNTFANPDQFPRMIWPTNYYKLACATMFTLFFAGNVYAPRCLVEMGQACDKMHTLSIAEFDQYQKDEFKIPRCKLLNIQPYLQSHYFNAISTLIQRIKSSDPDLLDNVVCGYDTLNEPSGGFLGCRDIERLQPHQEVRNGLTPTALQCMLLGEGVPCKVENWNFSWTGPRKIGTSLVNSSGIRCWNEQSKCIWLSHGVYSKEKGVALKSDYFFKNPNTGCEVDWISEFWRPFVREFTHRIRALHQAAIIFIEPPVNEMPPIWDEADGDCMTRVCYTPHWYDGITLMNKHFSTWWTIDYIGYKRGHYSNVLGALSFCMKGIRSNFAKQLGMIRDEGLAYIGTTPCLIGEIGIPFDMDAKLSYRSKSPNRFKAQELAMNANMAALEANLLNFTLWNYCPDNTHHRGDQWNGEDLSIWSVDDCEMQEFSRDKDINYAIPDKVASSAEIVTGLTPKSLQRNRLKQRTMASANVASLASISSADSPKSDNYKSTDNESSSSADHTLSRSHHRAQTLPEPRTIHSVDTLKLLAYGARALPAFLRPYPVFTAGTPIHMAFDGTAKLRRFDFLFQNAQGAQPDAPTVIFVPRLQFGTPLCEAVDDDTISKSREAFFNVHVSDGHWTYDGDSQLLYFFHDSSVSLNCKQIRGFYPESVNVRGAGVHEIVIEQLCKKKILKLMKTPSPSSTASGCTIS